MNTPLKILRIDSSGRGTQSVTRALGDILVQHLHEQHPVQLATRDVAQGMPFVNEEWINANFTDPDQRGERQQAALAHSDELVAELTAADVLVIGAPIYNFGIPATLKAWVDMIARARLTFRYTEHGPVGLLKNKRAILILASGGTPIGSGIDFASGYLRHVLGFVGISDVEIVAAERLMAQGDAAREAAIAQIARIGSSPRQIAA